MKRLSSLQSLILAETYNMSSCNKDKRFTAKTSELAAKAFGNYDNIPADASLLDHEFLAKNNIVVMLQPLYSTDMATCNLYTKLWGGIGRNADLSV